MSYNHFTISERAKLELLFKQGKSVREIGKELGKHYSSISREIKRNSIKHDYNCETAEVESKRRKKNCGRKLKLTDEVKKEIERKINLTFSPEQIANTPETKKMCFKSIYNWIYKGYLNVKLTKLRRKGKSKGCFATFVEQKTRFYWAIKMPDWSAESMGKAIKTFIEMLPNNAVKTFTVDRGKEFSCYKYVESILGIQVYFTDPYSSWQWGSNENTNGLLREFYPKKYDLATVHNDELNYNLMLINNRPRKCLAWKSAFERFFYECCN